MSVRGPATAAAGAGGELQFLSHLFHVLLPSGGATNAEQLPHLDASIDTGQVSQEVTGYRHTHACGRRGKRAEHHPGRDQQHRTAIGGLLLGPAGAVAGLLAPDVMTTDIDTPALTAKGKKL